MGLRMVPRMQLIPRMLDSRTVVTRCTRVHAGVHAGVHAECTRSARKPRSSCDGMILCGLVIYRLTSTFSTSWHE